MKTFIWCSFVVSALVLAVLVLIDPERQLASAHELRGCYDVVTMPSSPVPIPPFERKPEKGNDYKEWGWLYVRDDGDGYHIYFKDDAGKETRLKAGDGRP